MSLDIYLMNEPIKKKLGTGIFLRKDGKTYEASAEEVKEKFPDWEPPFTEETVITNEVFSDNITHNLWTMANQIPCSKDFTLYNVMWRPDEHNLNNAEDITDLLYAGMEFMEEHREELLQFNPSNGWGSYDVLLHVVENYYDACKKYPKATIQVSR